MEHRKGRNWGAIRRIKEIPKEETVGEGGKIELRESERGVEEEQVDNYIQGRRSQESHWRRRMAVRSGNLREIGIEGEREREL